jgi:hypothetical protein
MRPNDCIIMTLDRISFEPFNLPHEGPQMSRVSAP